MASPGTVGELTETLRQGGYLADRGLATALYVALELDRPVLLEGEVGVGKTEVAKVLAAVFARQLLHIRALSERQVTDEQAVEKLFGPRFLLERPLLAAIRAGDRAVLLID